MHEVEQHLSQPLLITLDQRRHSLIQLKLKRHFRRTQLKGECELRDLAAQLAHVARRELQLELARRNLREVKHVIDQVEQVMARLLTKVELLEHRFNHRHRRGVRRPRRRTRSHVREL